MPKPPGRRLRCRAHSKRTGLPCGNWAVTDWPVCRMHGARGGAPPQKLRGNQNSLRTGERSKVALNHYLTAHLTGMEAPVDPGAILRNLARTTHHRIQFLYVLWFEAAEELGRYGCLGNPWPEAFRLSQAVRKRVVRANGTSADSLRLEFEGVWRRWFKINDALTRLEGRVGRIADQLRALEGGVQPQGVVTVVVIAEDRELPEVIPA